MYVLVTSISKRLINEVEKTALIEAGAKVKIIAKGGVIIYDALDT